MIYWASPDRDTCQQAGLARHATMADRRHGAHYRTKEARETSVAARAVLRALLFRLTGRNDWQIKTGPRGKPELLSPEGRRGPLISLSHSHGALAVAVALGGPRLFGLGIDLEMLRPRKSLEQIAARSFGPAECLYVKAGGPEAFYRLWTLREAMGKATGAGLLLAADGTDRLSFPPGSTPHPRAAAHGWFLHSARQGGAMIAIAARGPGTDAAETVRIRL